MGRQARGRLGSGHLQQKTTDANVDRQNDLTASQFEPRINEAQRDQVGTARGPYLYLL